MRRKILASLLSLSLLAALCVGTAFAEATPKIIWLPEGVQAERNMEIDELDACISGTAICWDSQGNVCSLVDRTGKTITSLTSLENGQFYSISDELVCGTTDEKDFLINTTNGTVIPLECRLEYEISEGLIEASRSIDKPDSFLPDYKYGFVDTTGKIVVPLVYDSVQPFSEGLAAVTIGSNTFFIDTAGRTVLDLGTTYQHVESFSEGLAVVSDQNYKHGAIDRTGRLVIPMEYDRMENFSHGLSAVGKQNGTDAYGNPFYAEGFINRTGAVAIPLDYGRAHSFSDGLAVVGVHSGYEMDDYSGEYVQTHKYGFIDTTGKVVIPMIYDSVSFNWTDYNKAFNDGAAAVAKDGKLGLIDRAGNIVVPLKYDCSTNAYDAYFSNNVIAFYEGNGERGHSYLMDSRGNFAVPPEYEFKWRSPKYGEPGAFFDDVAVVGKNGKWGYMDRSGKLLLPLEYDEVSYASKGIGVVRQGSRYGIVDLYATPAPAPTPVGVQAMPTNDSLICDGVLQTPTVYKINGSNYFKIRDLAAILNGSAKQFSVGYDADKKSVTADTGAGYLKQPTDLTGTPAGGNKTATASSDAIYINGVLCQAEVYKIDGMNYFKLRDLGQALDFGVGWDGATGTVTLDTTRGYETQTPSAQNISDEELMEVAKALNEDAVSVGLNIANADFLQYDYSDSITVDDGFMVRTYCRVIGCQSIAQAEQQAIDLWYRIYSRRAPSVSEHELELMRGQLLEQNGILYKNLDGGVGGIPNEETVLERIVSRTPDEVVIAGHISDNGEIIWTFEFSLVLENGEWRYLER
ncbi:MAG: hypothetical protein HFF49_09655 [Lawsonibacter sp.]|jgi:hypothetical protein|nr:hypothetical protein [Lawsonibacter sp.]